MGISNLSFGSKHINTTNLRDTDKKESKPLEFVEFEQRFYDMARLRDAADYFDKKSGKKYGKTIFRDYIETYNKSGGGKKFFGLEDEDGTIQAIAETFTGCDSVMSLDYLYVNPQNSFLNKNRKYDKLGSKCFSEIVKYAKKQGTKCIVFFNAAEDFWARIPSLKNSLFGTFCSLNYEDFDDCSNIIDEKKQN